MVMISQASATSPARPSAAKIEGEHGDVPLGDDKRRDALLAGLLTVIGLGISAAFGLISPEGVVHFDDLTHYLYAKWAWQWPAYLLDDWGRPGFTSLYFLPAGIGWWACRILSALLSAGSAWLAFRIAQRMGLRQAWGVVVFCFAQPLFFQLSQTTLTETVLAFYLTAAVYLAQRGRWSWSAALVSIGIVTRHEAIVFLPVWAWFAWRGGVKPWRLWPIVWAPVVVNGAAWLADLRPAILRLFEPRPSGQYGHGGWLTFFSRSLEAWGPGIAVLAITGIRSTWRKTTGGGLVVTCILAYFCAQTIVRALGLFDSGGYARFLVAISPLVAIAALAGWHRLWAADISQRRSAVIVAGAAMVVLWLAMERQLLLHAARLDEAAHLPQLYAATLAVRVATAVVVLLVVISVAYTTADRVDRRATVWLVPTALAILILLACYGLCHPVRRPPEAEVVAELRSWLEDNGYADREVISAHVWLDYALDSELPCGRPTVRERLRRAEPGALFAWDRQFACEGHDLRYEEFRDHPAFRLIHRTQPAPGEKTPYLTVFEKTAR